MAHLGRLVRSGEKNQFTLARQSGRIYFKVLVTEKFTILPSQVNERYDFVTVFNNLSQIISPLHVKQNALFWNSISLAKELMIKHLKVYNHL